MCACIGLSPRSMLVQSSIWLSESPKVNTAWCTCPISWLPERSTRTNSGVVPAEKGRATKCGRFPNIPLLGNAHRDRHRLFREPRGVVTRYRALSISHHGLHELKAFRPRETATFLSGDCAYATAQKLSTSTHEAKCNHCMPDSLRLPSWSLGYKSPDRPRSEAIDLAYLADSCEFHRSCLKDRSVISEQRW